MSVCVCACLCLCVPVDVCVCVVFVYVSVCVCLVCFLCVSVCIYVCICTLSVAKSTLLRSQTEHCFPGTIDLDLRHANKLLSKVDFSLDGAIAHRIKHVCSGGQW